LGLVAVVVVRMPTETTLDPEATRVDPRESLTIITDITA
jgi:hypothetical protein